MNLNMQVWNDGTFGDVDRIENDSAYNIEHGAKMLAAIKFQVDQGQKYLDDKLVSESNDYSRDTDKITATLYNNLNATAVNDYGERVSNVKMNKTYESPPRMPEVGVVKIGKNIGSIVGDIGSIVGDKIDDIVKTIGEYTTTIKETIKETIKNFPGNLW